MIYRKRMLTFLLALCLMVSTALPAMAATSECEDFVVEAAIGTSIEYDGVIFEIVEGDQDPNKGPARSNFLVVDQDLTSTTGSQTISFNTSTDYPYYRIYIKNDSKVTYNITLTNASGQNQLTSSPCYLSAGAATMLTNSNAASGMRYLTVTASDGSALSGKVSIRVASNADELN